jgi:hypothetical protein
VKIITEIRNGYKLLSKYLLSFRKNLSLYKIFACNMKWQHFRILDGVSVVQLMLKIEECKGKCRMLCCLRKYLSKSITSIGRTHMDITPHMITRAEMLSNLLSRSYASLSLQLGNLKNVMLISFDKKLLQ